jgi:hypothetical protein
VGTCELVLARNHVQDSHLSWKAVGVSLVVLRSVGREELASSVGVVVTILVIDWVPLLSLWLNRATDHDRDLQRGDHHLRDGIRSIEEDIVDELVQGERRQRAMRRQRERQRGGKGGTLQPSTERARSWTLMRG